MNGSISIVRWLLIILAGVLAVIVAMQVWGALSTATNNGASVDQSVVMAELSVPPSGVIHYTDVDRDTGRSLQSSYSLDTKERVVEAEPADQHTVALVTVAGESVPVRGAFTSRVEGSLRPPVGDELTLEVPGGTITLAGYVYPRSFVWSDAAQALIFTDLSSDHVAASREGTVSADALGQTSSYSVYYATVDGVVREVVQGVSPQFSVDGQTIFYLGTDGVYQYELAVGLADRLIATPRLPTPLSSLAYVAATQSFYMLSTTDVYDNAALYQFTFDETLPGFPLTRTIALSNQNYHELTVSPDGTFAGFVQYTSLPSGVIADFQVVDLQTTPTDVVVAPVTLFQVGEWDRSIHSLAPTWTTS